MLSSWQKMQAIWFLVKHGFLLWNSWKSSGEFELQNTAELSSSVEFDKLLLDEIDGLAATEHIHNATRAFQAEYSRYVSNLQVDGAFGPVTFQAAMTCRRCGTLPAMRRRVSVWDEEVWRTGGLRIAATEFLKQFPKNIQLELIENAWQWWERACGISFRFANSGERPHISISVARAGEGGIDHRAGGVLAVAELPYRGARHVRLWSDPVEPWVPDLRHPQGAVSFERVIAHELGHNLGLDHAPSPGQLMSPYYDSRIFELQSWDTTEARKRYGERVATLPPPAQKEYLLIVRNDLSVSLAS